MTTAQTELVTVQIVARRVNLPSPCLKVPNQYTVPAAVWASYIDGLLGPEDLAVLSLEGQEA